MNKLVRNEQQKLLASFYNGVAIAAIGVGGLAPLVGIIQSAAVSLPIAIFVAICLASSFALHSLGAAALSELEE